MIKKKWFTVIIIMLISILAEVLVFNGKSIFSLNGTHQILNYIRQDNTIYARDMSGKPGYLYVGVNAFTENGTSVPVTMNLQIQDQGSSELYELETVTIYPLVEKSKYLAVHSYGDVEDLIITFESEQASEIQVTDIVYDAKVPWFISVVRILIVFAILCLLWVLRPASSIYSLEWTSKQKAIVVGGLVAVTGMFFWFLVRSNPLFLEPAWPYHQQYHQLAVALSQGEVSVNVASEETLTALKMLENPYDKKLRMNTVPNAGDVWDICYYEGNFYVYFGIVPVLLFYLPYYLVFNSAFPTWLGVFITGVGIVGGVYYLLDAICKKWFPQIPYALYLVLATISSNCLNLTCAMLRAEFYYVPVIMALCFTLWGLGLMISAADDWSKGKKYINLKIVLGALCLALTAGCRPQFLVGSFLLLPLFWPFFFQKSEKKQVAVRVLLAAIPYVLVAVGLMYYNYIRFGSVVDFGANYNLTTNDMTRRGFNFGRLPDGIFMYLFQPLSCKLVFPFAEATPFRSEYLGSTIKDGTFGGAFWIKPILLAVIGIFAVKKELVQKKVYSFALGCMCFSLLVVIADTEMSGILNRYYMDFLWLLLIPAMIVLLQLFEKYKGSACFKWLLCFVLIAGTWSMFYELGIAIEGVGLIDDNTHRYYMIKSLFQ